MYAEQFNAAGQALTQGVFRVNTSVNVSGNSVKSYLNDVQRYSSVSMDAAGDFVITWQSNNQDGSGYGVYAQAYNAAGQAVGGANEVQAIDFIDGFTGTFKLRWDNDDNPATPDMVSAPITFTGNAAGVVTAIQNALEAMGAEVEVVANSISEVQIEFVGASGDEYQQPLWISPSDVVKTGGKSTAQITVSVVTQGTGEFLVNDTTAGNQEFPDVAMDAAGDFVITWTSYGQDGDNATQGNVYAKRYGSTSIDWNPVASDSSSEGDQAQAADDAAKVISVDNPANHVVQAGTGYDGVVEVDTVDAGQAYMGSGSLLAGSNWVLTAAHVVWSDTFGTPLAPSQVTVDFDLSTGRVTVPVTQVIVNPGYDGTPEDGNDLALIQLQYVPTGVTGYQIYTGSNNVGQTAMLVGYGQTGTGNTGPTGAAGTKHDGLNRFEATGSPWRVTRIRPSWTTSATALRKPTRWGCSTASTT